MSENQKSSRTKTKIGVAQKYFKLTEGERYILLKDEFSGMPLYYPNLYITSSIRGASRSISSIESFISAYKVLCAWEIDRATKNTKKLKRIRNYNIEERFARGLFFTRTEIESIRDFYWQPLKELLNSSNVISLPKRKSSRAKIGKKKPRVQKKTINKRMSTILGYLEFLAEQLTINSKDPDISEKIKKLVKEFNQKIPKVSSRRLKDRDGLGLGKKTTNEVMTALKPGDVDNPYLAPDVQHRNYLMFELLRSMGIRRGELLNLRVDDFDFSKNNLKIVRRADDILDSRIRQPLVKTRERTLSLGATLGLLVNEYVLDIRRMFPRARRHPYLFVTHKAGPHQGSPISNSGFGKAISVLKKSDPGFALVHPHRFRHTWNDTYSELADKKGDMTPEQEEQNRSYLMGWSPTSGTAAIYNQRHIKKKANESSVDFQNKIIQNGDKYGQE